MTGIKLLVADVDGTLLTSDKRLTPATVDAVRELDRAGIRFALASARPPLGLLYEIARLNVSAPVAAFNGAMMVEPLPSLRTTAHRELSSRLVQPVASLLEGAGLDMWAYCGLSWYVKDRDGRRVAWETSCVGFRPEIIRSWADLPGRPAKLVGVSEDAGLLARMADELDARFRTALNAAASTPFYLDITPPGADKGTALSWLADYYGLAPSQVAAIGDGFVDVPMLLAAGVSFAMGNAPDAVKAMASAVTVSCDEDGFAAAAAKIISGQVSPDTSARN